MEIHFISTVGKCRFDRSMRSIRCSSWDPLFAVSFYRGLQGRISTPRSILFSFKTWERCCKFVNRNGIFPGIYSTITRFLTKSIGLKAPGITSWQTVPTVNRFPGRLRISLTGPENPPDRCNSIEGCYPRERLVVRGCRRRGIPRSPVRQEHGPIRIDPHL